MDTTPTPGGGPGGDGNGRGHPQAFVVGYRPHTGDMMVYGGGVVTLVGVLATVVNAAPGFLVVSIVGSLTAFYFHPTLDLRAPQLGADTEGLYVARIGLIPWSEVAEMHVERRALRTMHLSTLVIRTVRPPRKAVSVPETVPVSRRLTARPGRISGGTIRVDLHPLSLDADAIERRLRALMSAAGR